MRAELARFLGEPILILSVLQASKPTRRRLLQQEMRETRTVCACRRCRAAAGNDLALEQPAPLLCRVDFQPVFLRVQQLKHSRSEEHTSELQSPDHLVCRLLLEKKKTTNSKTHKTINT